MSRSSKVGKSRPEKDLYTKVIKTLDSESTVDTSLSFPRSDKPGKESAIPNYPRVRRDTISESIAEHFRENWLPWAVSIAGIVLAFFIFAFNRDVGKLEGKVETFEKGLENNSKSIHDLNKKVDEKFDTQRGLMEKINLDVQKLDLKLQHRK